MKKINAIDNPAPLAFVSCFSFGKGCIEPLKMAKHLKSAGFSHLPITDQLSTAGLFNSLKAAETFQMQPLYGQKFVLKNKSILVYPDDKNAFCWLNHLISELRGKFSQDLLNSMEEKDLSDTIIRIPPKGSARVIFSGIFSEHLPEIFLDSGWEIFFAVGQTRKIDQVAAINSAIDYYQAKAIYAPEIFITSSADQQTLRLLTAIYNGNLYESTSIATPDFPIIKNLENSSALANNREFLNQPTFVPERGKLKMPSLGQSAEISRQMLREKCQAGLARKYPNINPAITQRVDFELATINELGFTDYFLVVDEITRKAKELGVRVLGRGSAANSIISYILDFTQVDPLKHNLYFERFLNPHRKSPPDIDLDFSWKIRDQIYQFLKERWGVSRVAMISTHIRLSGRSAMRETGKALGVNNEELNYLSSLLGHSSIEEFIKNPDKLARYRPDRARIEQHLGWLKMAAGVEGLPTHFSIHAGGVVIAPDSLYNYSILEPSSKVLPITHVEMHGCEEAGLVKFDLLSQRALGVYADVVKTIESSIPDSSELIEQDQQIMQCLARGDTLGVFYIESPGMRGLLGKLQCQSFSELIAASSIIRPGVAESGMMQEYIRRHLNPNSWKPVHPLLGQILQETYGIMVYQEDVMKVAHHLAGFSLGEADILRRAMSGKERSPQQMQQAKERFLKGAAGNGIDKAIACEVWRQISSFCGYAFCKAHSAAYAVLSLELLWSKVHFPAVFFAAVINNRGGFYGPQAYISAAKRSGIKILPPEVNKSLDDFSIIAKNTLRTGLSFIANLAAATRRKIIETRDGKPFSSLIDFIDRVAPSEDEFENLVKSGSLKSFGEKTWCRWQFKTAKKAGLFSEELAALPAPLQNHGTVQSIIKDELKSLGFALSGHPTELFPAGKILSNQLPALENRQVEVTGLLIATKSVTTSRNEKMKFITIEDRNGLIEVVIFPAVWKKISASLDKAMILTVGGTVKNDSGQLVINAKWLKQY